MTEPCPNKIPNWNSERGAQRRERILEYVAAHPNASAKEMGEALGLKIANLRHHVRILRQTHKISLLNQNLAKGSTRRKGLVTLTMSIPEDVFEAVRDRAEKERTSFTKQAVLMMEWGLLEAEAE